MRFLWDAFLQVGLGIIWTPLFVLTVVHDLWLEWKERRIKARINCPENRRTTISCRDKGIEDKG